MDRQKPMKNLALSLALGACLLASLAWMLARGDRARGSAALERGGVSPSASVDQAPSLTAGPHGEAAEPQRELSPAAPAEDEAVAPGKADSRRGADERVTLRVRVLDVGGGPAADVGVELHASVAGFPVGRSLAVAETDADGHAALEASRRFVLDFAERSPGATLDVRVRTPVDPPIAHRLPPGELPEDVIELVLTGGARAWLRSFDVRVVNAAGAPQEGVPLVFRAVRVDKPDDLSELGRATTDARGLARFSRDGQGALIGQSRLFGQSYRCEVVCAEPFLPAPGILVPEPTPDAPPDALVLELPPTGRALVALRAADGKPVTQDAKVSVLWRSIEARDDEHWIHMRANSVDVRGGRAVFERVGLGLALRLTGWLEDGSVDAATLEIEGPARAGDERHAPITFAPPRPVLTGRLRDEEGRPVAEQAFTLLIDLVDPPPRSPAAGPRRPEVQVFLTSDADGGFRLPLSPFDGAARRVQIVERAPRAGAPPGWVARCAEVPLPARPSADGSLALGDLALTPLPVVVAGRVVDPDGEPARARIDVFYALGEGRERNWQRLQANVAGPDEEGRFAIHSLTREEELSVAAAKNKGGASPIRYVRRGARGVELVLAPPAPREAAPQGRILGRVLLDEGVPTDRLVLEREHLLDAAGEQTKGSEEDYLFDAPLCLWAQPGTHELRVLIDGSSWILARVEDIRVVAGEDTRDPRLDPLDLRGRTRWLRLRILTADGRPLANAGIRVRDGRQRGGADTDDEGRALVLVPAELERFTLYARGEPLELLWQAQELEVRLTE